jgi:rhamnosyltransferase
MKSSSDPVPRVCVLLATYNGAPYLKEQLLSISTQVDCECTIIAQDDGSSDGTMSILNEHNVLVLNGSSEQLGASVNFFSLLKYFSENCSQDNFDFVALADQDDIWLPNKISRAISVLGEGYDCYSSGFFEYTKKNGVWKRGREVKKKFIIKPLSYLARSPGPGFTYVFKSDVIARLAGDKLFQSMFSNKNIVPRWHDWALFAFASRLNFEWVVDECAATLYRLHDSNHTGLISYRNFLSRISFFFGGSYYREMVKIAHIGGDVGAHEKLIRMSMKDRIYFITRINEFRSKFVDKLFLLLLFLTVR